VFRDLATKRQNMHPGSGKAPPLPNGAPFIVIHRDEQALLSRDAETEPPRKKLEEDNPVRLVEELPWNPAASMTIIIESLHIEPFFQHTMEKAKGLGLFVAGVID
jgi:hypothetical protein